MFRLAHFFTVLLVVMICQAAPIGRHYAAESTTTVRGNAFDQAFDERSEQRARSLQ